MRKFILFTLIFSGLIANAQQDELINHLWYLQKLIINDVEYVTPINEEVSEVSAQFGDNYLMTGVCNGFGGEVEFDDTGMGFTLSDVSVTLMDCAMSENSEFESQYFWQFFYVGTELAQPYSYYIVDENDYLMLTINNSLGRQAIYHSQNTVSVSPINQANFEFSIYPNPANSKIFIKDSENRNTLSVNFTNILGLQIMSKSLINNHTELDVSHLNAGVYLVQIYEENESLLHSEKIIIE
ncbi:T9SS type A sorting domain-containing protein [Lentimicrobium sp. S6]|uniref:T9SS type A sorting domain-containing protein n=1 Tax=Lentimicrobium sp. S6 TaxID=2735872 RepID=UPI001557A272|nr:T9SS type A sorting domain-containing protein [Lentimicrobium sp. S6]NPD45611.1 T9SS type A sorting domain-containing protein [Lentimicrobium sp. S6]